nr:MAG: glycosyltransferase [Leptolyngbya sp. IPPAS B-1204]
MLLNREPNLSWNFDIKDAPSIMVFSPWYYGHHPTYIRHLILQWKQRRLPGILNIVTMPSFLEKHEEIVSLADQNRSSVHFVSFTAEEENHLSTSSNLSGAFRQYQLIVRYVKQLEATHALLMHFDSCQLPFVIGYDLPCSFSAIYFRPTFHYNKFFNYTPTWKERIQQLRERIFLSRLLAHPQLKTLLCLDPFAVSSINQCFSGSAKAVHLPDPVEFQVPEQDQVNYLKAELGIEPDRKVFLAFGLLADERKGTRQLLDALHTLEPELCRKLCILLVGEPFQAGQTTLEAWLSPVSESLPVQIVTKFGYIPESEVPLYFRLADAVLAPYQKHQGMSGILLLAAAAQKPVLSSNYGLMGDMLRRYELGVAIDTTIPDEITQGLTRLLCEPFNSLCNPEQMKSLANLHSVEQFASTIFQHLYRN